MQLIILIVVGWLAYGWMFPGPQWDGWLYPDRNNLSHSLYLGKFDDVQQCRTSAYSRAQMMMLSTTQIDYECGYKCYHKGGLNVCKETTN
jgi:hypothetical protein